MWQKLKLGAGLRATPRAALLHPIVVLSQELRKSLGWAAQPCSSCLPSWKADCRAVLDGRRPRQGKREVFLSINSHGGCAHSPCLGVAVSQGRIGWRGGQGRGAVATEREVIFGLGIEWPLQRRGWRRWKSSRSRAWICALG